MFCLLRHIDRVHIDVMRKYSEGTLYKVSDVDVISMYNVELSKLHLMSENDILNCDAKPDLLQLFSNTRFRESVCKDMMQKVLSDRRKDSKTTPKDKDKDKDTSYDTRKFKADKPSRNALMNNLFSKTSYRAFSFSENANKKSKY